MVDAPEPPLSDRLAALEAEDSDLARLVIDTLRIERPAYRELHADVTERRRLNADIVADHAESPRVGGERIVPDPACRGPVGEWGMATIDARRLPIERHPAARGARERLADPAREELDRRPHFGVTARAARRRAVVAAYPWWAR
jgi:hypothetical protein